VAGFIFSIFKNDGIEGMKKRIYEGDYASIVPAELGNLMSKQVAASVLADYCSMKAGDNVYFLCQRRIYGVGKLVNLDGDCKYKNYIRANIFEEIKEFNEQDAPLKNTTPNERWICFFEPEKDFFANGVDMDDVLKYKPDAFRMLRAFQDRSFIKIDDEENRALKEFIYLSNIDNQVTFEYSNNEHDRIRQFPLERYMINPADVIIGNIDEESGEVSLEMLVEAGLVDKIIREGFEGETYDYVSHQVIASPFKPISYIDKIDIFAYRTLDNYPDLPKPISKYLIMELKKGKANKESILQLMGYVDWVCQEYASGDYSKIEARVVAKDYVTKDIQETLDNECRRSYISSTHPNQTTNWSDIKLMDYYVDGLGVIEVEEYDTFDSEKYLKDSLGRLGWIVSKGKIQSNGETYLPTFKVQKKKLAFFRELDDTIRKDLNSLGWRVIDLSQINDSESVDKLIIEFVK